MKNYNNIFRKEEETWRYIQIVITEHLKPTILLYLKEKNQKINTRFTEKVKELAVGTGTGKEEGRLQTQSKSHVYRIKNSAAERERFGS